jgi:hypothetical protein
MTMRSSTQRSTRRELIVQPPEPMQDAAWPMWVDDVDGRISGA